MRILIVNCLMRSMTCIFQNNNMEKYLKCSILSSFLKRYGDTEETHVGRDVTARGTTSGPYTTCQ